MIKTLVIATTLVLLLSFFGWISNKLFAKRRAEREAKDAEHSRIVKEERRANVIRKISSFDSNLERYFQNKNEENKTNLRNSWNELHELHMSIFIADDQKEEIAKRKALYEEI